MRKQNKYKFFQTGKNKTKYLDNNLNFHFPLLHWNIYVAQLNNLIK